MKYFVICWLIVLSCKTVAQETTNISKQEKIQSDTLYNSAEKYYMGNWVSQQVDEMNLSEVEYKAYYSILTKHTQQMAELSQKVIDSSKVLNEKQKFLDIVEKMNLELKAILSEDQYNMHVKSFDIIVWNVFLRKGWDRD